MHRFREWWAEPPHAATTAFFALVLLAAVGFFRVESIAEDQVNSVRTNQVSVCKDSLEPGGVRWTLAEMYREEIKQSRQVDYSRFFPQVPEDELNALIEQQNDRRRQRVQQLLDVDCEAFYSR